MKISTLIKELQDTLQKQGDIDVIIAVDTAESTEGSPQVDEYELDPEICIGYGKEDKEYCLILQADRTK